MTQEMDTSLLPGILREIRELIGQAATLKLVSKYGGVRVYIPKALYHEHPLVVTVGMMEASALVNRYRGEVLEIPKAQLANVAQRNIAIKQEYKELSQRQLARKYNLTERQVRNILCSDKTEDNQIRLF